jgi:hypothetical protein
MYNSNLIEYFSDESPSTEDEGILRYTSLQFLNLLRIIKRIFKQDILIELTNNCYTRLS